MRRGTHDRRWIRCPDLDYSGWEEFELLHEEAAQAPGYGVFGVIEHHYREKFYVIWRKNRNTTRDTTVMRDPLGSEQHIWNREEVAYSTVADAIDSIAAWNTCFEFPEKRKRYRVRDAQKGKVYRWEHQMAADIGPTEPNPRFIEGQHPEHARTINVLEQRHGEDFLRNALDHMCINLGEEAPELKFRSGGSSSYGGRHRIRLLPSHRNLLVLIHELAHTLHSRWGRNTEREQSHGAEFVGIYAYLLIRFGGVNREAIVRHAVKARVKMHLPDRYWIWADEAIRVETDEDFTDRVKEAARPA